MYFLLNKFARTYLTNSKPKRRGLAPLLISSPAECEERNAETPQSFQHVTYLLSISVTIISHHPLYVNVFFVK